MGNLHYFELIHDELVCLADFKEIKESRITYCNKKKILKLMFKSHYLLSNNQKNLNEKFIFFQYVESFIKELKKELI